jgi:hypothetical protein
MVTRAPSGNSSREATTAIGSIFHEAARQVGPIGENRASGAMCATMTVLHVSTDQEAGKRQGREFSVMVVRRRMVRLYRGWDCEHRTIGALGRLHVARPLPLAES